MVVNQSVEKVRPWPNIALVALLSQLVPSRNIISQSDLLRVAPLDGRDVR